MNYQNIYNQLINSRLDRKLVEDVYYERHHIIPRFAGGLDDETNIITLTAREHYIAHALLVQIYKNTEFISKAICAFRFMSVSSRHNEYRDDVFNSYSYAWARKMFSENHPCKDEHVRNKIAEAVSAYAATDDFIINLLKLRVGKGQLIIPDGMDISDFMWLYDEATVECACGCGQAFIKKNHFSETKFIVGHWQKDVIYTEDRRNKLSNTVKDNLSNLTKSEMTYRMKNSFGNCDHEKRGLAISKGKKGKPTNQKYLSCIKYGIMSDSEFKKYIEDRKPGIKERMRKFREHYINGTYINFKI